MIQPGYSDQIECKLAAISKKGNGTGNGTGNGMGSGNGKVIQYMK